MSMLTKFWRWLAGVSTDVGTVNMPKAQVPVPEATQPEPVVEKVQPEPVVEKAPEAKPAPVPEKPTGTAVRKKRQFPPKEAKPNKTKEAGKKNGNARHNRKDSRAGK